MSWPHRLVLGFGIAALTAATALTVVFIGIHDADEGANIGGGIALLAALCAAASLVLTLVARQRSSLLRRPLLVAALLLLLSAGFFLSAFLPTG